MSGICTCFVLAVIIIIFSALASESIAQSEIDPGFKPVLSEAEFTSREARQGDKIGLTLKFVNEGTRAAREDYKVFLHFEYPDLDCGNIKIHTDHDPTRPTSTWRPGEVIVDGPYAIDVPADLADGEYHVHVGLYAPVQGGGRLLDTTGGTLTISGVAPLSSELQPDPLPKSEIAKRREALAKRLKNPITLDAEDYRFSIDRDSGAFQLLDKRTGVLWGSNPTSTWFGTVQLTDGKTRYTVPIEKFDSVIKTDDGLEASISLMVNGQPTYLALTVFVEQILSEPQGIRFRYDTGVSDDPNAFWTTDGAWQVQSIRILDNAFWTADADDGYSVVPFRLGEMLPTDSGLPTTRRYLTYNGSSMALYGAIKQDSALLMAWPHPDTELEVQTAWWDLPLVGGRRAHSASITLRGEAREFSVHPLGKGTYVGIGRAYRHIAKRNGWLVTWAEKRQDFPTVDKMFGAADFKPFVFSRTIPTSRFNSTGEEQTNLSYTFEEAAKVAEHLHRDLEIDKAMYVLAGWIHRGYDNQHPDILPAAPECGGNDALMDCAQIVKDCGFLFGLHDNYQDMYEDAPSWDVKYLNKNANGEPRMGGNWAGGQAWQVCAIQQVNLAARSDINLPRIAKLFGPSIYFIDTTFAWGLVTCEDPAHLMSRSDDMQWKSNLCDLSKELFELFGSEEGREWAVPHADYMEGLLSHKLGADRPGRGFSRRGDGIVIPMFEIVYGDCVNLYGHQGDRATPSRPDYILNCLIYAEMPLYAFGPHLYYEEDVQESLPVTVEVEDFQNTEPGVFQLTYRWKVSGNIAEDYRCFVHFTHPEGERDREGIAFQDDHELPKPTSTWKAGDVIEDGPRTMEVPEKYQGKSDIWIGLINQGGRVDLKDLFNSRGRHHIGSLEVDGEKVTFRRTERPQASRDFARADNGWAQELNETDRMIKNTYEVLSWVNRLTAETPMTDHLFLTDDRSVEWSQFGDLQIWVNYGTDEYTVPYVLPHFDSQTVLPQYGFLVVSPTFIAFHAASFGGLDYENPVLFTVRSLDGKSLAESDKIRIYHGFGDSNIQLIGKSFRVERESIITEE